MVFFKQAELKDAENKYGFKHHGIFAKEFIKRGESIFTCDLNVCDYLKIEDKKKGKTWKEIQDLFQKHPESRDFIHKYMYMIDDDLYDYPRNFLDQITSEDCMFFNHSCNPNTGFEALDSSLVVAIKDIEPGEELTYDYQCMDTEASSYRGLNCKCGEYNCRGILKFDQYRYDDWQKRLYKYSGDYVKKKIEELKTKWHSSRCCLRYYSSEDKTKNELEYGLTALEEIKKQDLVAIFYDPNNINKDAHYIRHSENANCFLIGTHVYASKDLSEETELTLNYNQKN